MNNDGKEIYMTTKMILFLCFLIGLLLIAACTPQTSKPVEVESQKLTDKNSPSPSDTLVATETSPIFQPEPQQMKFQSMDGTELEGLYYPSADQNSPLIVLMHWAQGDQSDWTEIAFWLQNRGLLGTAENPKNLSWLDASWFPAMDPGISFAVFTFTFRNCAGGCKSSEREGWLMDAQSAAEFARSLPNIDGTRIIFIGASIGSDGAADACLYLNLNFPGACWGAMSLSPGDYLTEEYSDVVEDLGAFETPVPVWCLYSEDDQPSFEICNGITAGNFKGIVYPSGAISGFPHGMNLIQPDVSPNPLNLMLDFLEDVAR